MKIDNNPPIVIYKPKKPVFCSSKPIKQFSNYIFVREKEHDFLSQPTDKIFNRIKKSLKDFDNNFLGIGSCAEVYKIKGTNYCVRVPLFSSEKMYEEFSRDLSKEDMVNHTVAKLGGGATIMPIIKGYTYNSRNKNVTKMVENMPIKAFKNLFMQIYVAEKGTNLRFDACSYNIMIQPKKHKLTAIDFHLPECQFENKTKILNSVFTSLGIHSRVTNKQQKILAGKLFLSGLSILSEHPNIKPVECGFIELLNEIEYMGLISNNNSEILRNNFKNLGSGNKKVTEMLVKQIFEIGANPNETGIHALISSLKKFFAPIILRR